MNESCVTCRVGGCFPERFLSRALEDGVRPVSIKRDGRYGLVAVLRVRDVACIRAMCERYGMEFALRSEGGAVRAAKWMKRRYTLGAGLIVALALAVFVLGHVWLVDIAGELPDQAREKIVRAAAELGAKPGAPVNSVDTDWLGTALMAALPEYSHIGVIQQGTRIRIEAIPGTDSPEMFELGHSRDLVANRDAVVLSVTPLCGQAAVKAGDTVRRGQLLIRGEERITSEETRGVRALGSVWARVWITGEASAPLVEDAKHRTGKTATSSALVTPYYEFPLTRGEEITPCETETERLPVGGLFFPVEIVRVTRWEIRTQRVTLDYEKQLALAKEQAEALARSQLPEGSEEVACWFDVAQEEARVTVRAVIEVKCDIAAAR